MGFPDRDEVLNMGEGIEVLPSEAHQMRNDSDFEAEFLVVSAQKVHGDRIMV